MINSRAFQTCGSEISGAITVSPVYTTSTFSWDIEISTPRFLLVFVVGLRFGAVGKVGARGGGRVGWRGFGEGGGEGGRVDANVRILLFDVTLYFVLRTVSVSKNE